MKDINQLSQESILLESLIIKDNFLIKEILEESKYLLMEKHKVLANNENIVPYLKEYIDFLKKYDV